MKHKKILKEKEIKLKLIEIQDTEFILLFRLDENLNKYINKVKNI